MQILPLGPKFCTTTSKVNELTKKVQTEDHVLNSYDNADLFKSTVLNCCLDYINKIPSFRNLLYKEHLKQLIEVKGSENVIMTRPDKFSGIVLMNESDYLIKLWVILSDDEKLQKQSQQKDLNEQTERRQTITLQKMENESTLNSKLYEQLRSSGSTKPCMYGYPKVHKQDVSFHLILGMTDSTYHSVAKRLVEIIGLCKKLSRYNHCGKLDFVDSITDVAEKKMVSLDIVSLFTSVPLTVTVYFLCDYIQSSSINVGIPIR
ncbi:unnamed protein product [Trichobilharzia regenti]|nr:unnamed protein product [Trichobilharzia regenti]